jgi:hypothetical protein
MIQAVVVRAFASAKRLAERVAMTRPERQLVRFRMFVVMMLQTPVEQVAPAEFRLALMTLRVVR